MCRYLPCIFTASTELTSHLLDSRIYELEWSVYFHFSFGSTLTVLLQTIISQDVSLFTGTLRSNLDPFDEHTDEECLEVLERCHLTSILGHSSSQIALDMPISQTGSLSAGERQLVAMARALLRRSNVVIMDEATSQIDIALDDQVSIPGFKLKYMLLNIRLLRFNGLSEKNSAVPLLSPLLTA